ncbi:MAG TPA: hypothetical protein VN643_25985 [Pyrinomonadaceae bacterium]|nr:hypothetical protein [Pyrinomonadaceae bacterium]
MSRESSKQKHANRKPQQSKEPGRVSVESLSVTQREFNALLAECDFISKVIQIYREDAAREFADRKKYAPNHSAVEFEEGFRFQEEFIRKYLPGWLWSITEILTLEAFCASLGEPLEKSKMAELVNFSFVERGPGERLLKDGRNEIWNRHLLGWALGQVLSKFKVGSAITLAATAKKINQLPKRGMLRKMKRALTGKHLQKLLQDHDIDWLKEKKRYQNRLAEEKRIKKTAK